MPQAAVIAVVVAGVAISAYAAQQQGSAAKRQAEAQAELTRQQADAARDQAEVTEETAAREKIISRQNEEDFRLDQSRLMASRRALLGVSGVEPGSGSPLLVSEDFAGEAELQALRLRSGGEVRVTRLEQQANQQRREGGFLDQQANLEIRAGRDAQRAGNLRAGSLLVSGVGKAFGSGAAIG